MAEEQIGVFELNQGIIPEDEGYETRLDHHTVWDYQFGIGSFPGKLRAAHFQGPLCRS
jgi:hypothetical protein